MGVAKCVRAAIVRSAAVITDRSRPLCLRPPCVVKTDQFLSSSVVPTNKYPWGEIQVNAITMTGLSVCRLPTVDHSSHLKTIGLRLGRENKRSGDFIDRRLNHKVGVPNMFRILRRKTVPFGPPRPSGSRNTCANFAKHLTAIPPREFCGTHCRPTCTADTTTAVSHIFTHV